MSDPDVSLELKGGDRAVLYGLSSPERGAVARLHLSGRRRWICRPPPGHAEDAFVALRLDGDTLVATTFQGRRTRIDLDTGRATDLDFVK